MEMIAFNRKGCSNARLGAVYCHIFKTFSSVLDRKSCLAVKEVKWNKSRISRSRRSVDSIDTSWSKLLAEAYGGVGESCCCSEAPVECGASESWACSEVYTHGRLRRVQEAHDGRVSVHCDSDQQN